MPLISITRLRVRSFRFLPTFALHVWRSRKQVQHARGFQGGSLLIDRHWTFWTMTTWDGEENMRRYMTTGAHRIVMPRLLDWCDEASVVHWMQSEAALPSWAEADRQMRESGRPSKVRNPSPQHAALTYHTPRRTGSGPTKPTLTPKNRA
ncbi:DUF3291 domain-containing protein [Methylobacterium oxalidis]|uniref:DUF3291 domain-containing protein n=1 Tax=Methylobacterium oxalidis TaxID=944322 RepID=A0A512JDQ6_9HYPH|nr:DUF3291 domain-containing protein [Methylobacterium oxalidis]GEP08083.1 hypothetical protein MOX02_61210 [Methylobacterium oxalidis]GJE35883.1 hypothetical protein LDDCCGHA_6104 [Methylobacterium oxalidis]GLS62245.1 hypothetical protein GCM10007888_06260 [Methylobacterium oxalidis]